MPEALDVTCPCCEALLKLDPETGTIIWADKKKAPAKDFDDLVSRVEAQRSGLDAKFARSVQQTKRAGEMLDKKFEEARRRALDDVPLGRMVQPEEVGALVVYLASAGAAAMTGQAISLCGGATMG